MTFGTWRWWGCLPYPHWKQCNIKRKVIREGAQQNKMVGGGSCWPFGYTYIHSFIYLSDDRSDALPKRFLHIVRSRAFSFEEQYPLLPIRPSISFLRLLPRLLITYISPFIFPSITCFTRQFSPKMWPIQLAFRFLISCRILALYIIYVWL
jgi:hypothetical protein